MPDKKPDRTVRKWHENMMWKPVQAHNLKGE